MSLWQRLVDRFVPELPDQPSRLDMLDGVGRAADQRAGGDDRQPSPGVASTSSSPASAQRTRRP